MNSAGRRSLALLAVLAAASPSAAMAAPPPPPPSPVLSPVLSPHPPSLPATARMRQKLSGKHVLITGPTSGLGLSLLSALLPLSPLSVTLVSSSAGKLEELKSSLARSHPGLPVIARACDLADPGAVAELRREVEAGPKIDLLLLNAGLSSRSSFLDTAPAVDDRLMQVNFLSQASLLRAVVASSMLPQRAGLAVWISSVQGYLPLPLRSSYVASKHAVQGYTASVRAELASHNVSLATCSPGYVRTGLSLNAARGDGERHGVMDETTEGAPEPGRVAHEILDRAAGGEVDFTVVGGRSAAAARWLSFCVPRVFREIMRRRAVNMMEAGKKDE